MFIIDPSLRISKLLTMPAPLQRFKKYPFRNDDF